MSERRIGIGKIRDLTGSVTSFVHEGLRGHFRVKTREYPQGNLDLFHIEDLDEVAITAFKHAQEGGPDMKLVNHTGNISELIKYNQTTIHFPDHELPHIGIETHFSLLKRVDDETLMSLGDFLQGAYGRRDPMQDFPNAELRVPHEFQGEETVVQVVDSDLVFTLDHGKSSWYQQQHVVIDDVEHFIQLLKAHKKAVTDTLIALHNAKKIDLSHAHPVHIHLPQAA